MNAIELRCLGGDAQKNIEVRVKIEPGIMMMLGFETHGQGVHTRMMLFDY